MLTEVFSVEFAVFQKYLTMPIPYFIFYFQKISFKRFNDSIGRLNHDNKSTYQTCPSQETQRAEECPGMELNGQSFEVKEKFCYPVDVLGSALNKAIAEITKEWNKFRTLLPFLTCRSLPLGAKWR